MAMNISQCVYARYNSITATLALYTVTSVMIMFSVRTSLAYVTRIDQCEPIEIPRCRSMPYNMTQMPNLMHHNTQENARLVFEKFEILIDQHCSDVLLFLLCSIYVPICAVSLQPDAIPPCRSVCERARAGCEPLMNAYKVPWPESLDCSKLPSYERGVCVSPEAFVKPTKTATDCPCKRRKPSYRIFKKYNYNYGIHALVINKSGTDQEVMYEVKVIQTLFSGRVTVPVHSDVILWVNSTCACPKLRKDREILILGHEDSTGTKLMITPLSVAVLWRDNWAIKIQRWQEQLRNHPSDGKRKQSAKSRSNKRKAQQVKASQFTTNDQGVITHKPLKQSARDSGRLNIGSLTNGHTHGGRYYMKGFPR